MIHSTKTGGAGVIQVPASPTPGPGLGAEPKLTGAFVSLILGTILFALGAPVLKLLMNSSSELGLKNPTSLSFCNVLFVGNLCAGIVTLMAAGPPKIFAELRGLSGRVRGYLFIAALASTIHPALLYTALEQTTVINIVLLSRFNGIVYVAVAYIALRTMVERSEFIGYAVMAGGVLILLFVNNQGFSIQWGDAYVLLATVFFALTEVVSKKVLPHCSIAAYIFVRNTISAALFFGVAIWLFGAEHFAEAFAGDLWILMLVYAGVAIVAAQLFWLRAVKVLPVQAIVNTQLLNPLFSLLFAFLLLGEFPTLTQALVIVIVIAGMLVRVVGHRTPERVLQIDTGLVAR